MDTFELTEPLARKVLEVVDVGLCPGLGQPRPGAMCIEAAVCYAMGEPHGDKPSCVSPALRAFKIGLNDANWSSNEARAKGMRRLAISQLGSAGVLDDVVFVNGVAVLAQKWAAKFAAKYATEAAEAAKYAKYAKYAAEAAAKYAAKYAKYATEARDKVLAQCAEDVVQLLLEMKAPGCQFLYLTEGTTA